MSFTVQPTGEDRASGEVWLTYETPTGEVEVGTVVIAAKHASRQVIIMGQIMGGGSAPAEAMAHNELVQAFE